VAVVEKGVQVSKLSWIILSVVAWTLILFAASFTAGFSLGEDRHTKTATGEQLQIQQELRQENERLKKDLKVKQGDFLTGMAVESRLKNIIIAGKDCIAPDLAREIERQGYTPQGHACK